MYFNPQDHYFKQAKKEGFKARSAYKLEEIDKKYRIFDKTVKTVMDVGCSPGSWLQYVHQILPKATAIGFDIKDTKLDMPRVFTYVQDIQDTDAVRAYVSQHNIEAFDVIISDMAPNTIGYRDVDAMRSIELLRTTLPLYQHFLKPDGKAIIKIFMGPGFEEFLTDFKKIVGTKNVKVFKPAACRRESKETYIVKW